MNIVLAHGFLGFKRLFGVDYFNGVAEFLRETLASLPIKVLVTEVKPFGRIHVRGRELGEQIVQALADGQLDSAEQVHVIAHSMGGLDARYCISPGNPDNIAQHVASLTTIATPHRGSPVADLLTGQGRLTEALGDRPDAILDMGGGVLDLTAQGADRFNEQYPDHPKVRYFWYAGRGRDGAGDAVLLP